MQKSPSVTNEFPDASIENTVELSRPPLQALISVENRLNPFGLDAEHYEEISLRDVLRAAAQDNLDILGLRYGTSAQKFSYLSAATQFLPDMNLGYNKMLVNAYVPIPITAVVAPGAPGLPSAIGASTIATKINTPITQLTSGFVMPIFTASNFSKLLEEKHRLRATRAQLSGTINDTLMTASRDYYSLLLNQALLQIQTAAVERSVEQYRTNSTLEQSGLATNLDVLQAKAQLARDRQNLIDQQKTRRNSAIQLAHVVNLNLGQDLVAADQYMRKVRLISRAVTVPELLRLAIDNRPELKQYDELRQVAKASILTAAAPLAPNVTLGGNIYGVGVNIGNLGPVYLLNFGVKWSFGGLGMTDLANIKGAKYRARQALVDANKEFLNVYDQVRTSFNESLSSERRIDEAIDEVAAAQEELRLAKIRLETGLGINIDVLNAQRDLTQANIGKAQAISDFNIAQAQLLHNIGLITVDNLSSGHLVTPADLTQTK